MLIIEDDITAAERLVRRLELAGLSFLWERVDSEPTFRDALTRAPDIILSKSEAAGFSGMAALAITKQESPRTPFVFLTSRHEADAAGLAATVRKVLRSARRTDQRKLGPAASDTSGIASYLLERREVLDRTLRQQDRSPISSSMRRTPPSPTAVVMLESTSVRERFAKLLRNANIEIDEVEDVGTALARLESQTHAVMFTDRVDLIRAARQLHAGAATHIVFVGPPDDPETREAWRAGANECMPEEPGGEEFWAHLTTARRIVSLAASLQLALSDNRILSTVDELTGCGSRRFFEQEFPREVERATRLGWPLALIMADIDHFKQVNDRYGHRTGDDVLAEFGERLSQGLRLGQDWLARVGGEEFAIVLPETSHEDALQIAERLRTQIGTTAFPTGNGNIRVTASFGVCGVSRVRKNGIGVAEALISAADAALYESKGGGRNRVTGFAEISP